MKCINKYSLAIIISTAMSFTMASVGIASSDFIEDAPEVKTTFTQEEVMLDKTSAMDDYIAQSRRRIKNNWYPPTSSFENAATILVTLNKKGKLLDCKILSSSNNDGFDESLIKAVKKTKFSPLPDEFKGDSVDIDFTFNMERRHITK